MTKTSENRKTKPTAGAVRVADNSKPALKIAARTPTRSNELRDQLEQMILEGQLAPGDRLDETELAKRFNLSRTPVREALKALLATGLIEVRGRQGAHVATPSIPALIEMFDMMAALEGLCAKLAARRASAEEKREMRAVHAELVEAYAQGDAKTFFDINQKFHDLLYKSAHTHFIAEQTIYLRRRLATYRLKVTYQPGRMHDTLAEHLAIIDAIEAGDSPRAEKAARDHVELLGDQLADFISALSSDGSLRA